MYRASPLRHNPIFPAFRAASTAIVLTGTIFCLITTPSPSYCQGSCCKTPRSCFLHINCDRAPTDTNLPSHCPREDETSPKVTLSLAQLFLLSRRHCASASLTQIQRHYDYLTLQRRVATELHKTPVLDRPYDLFQRLPEHHIDNRSGERDGHTSLHALHRGRGRHTSGGAKASIIHQGAACAGGRHHGKHRYAPFQQ
jgi:hypothetical protein